MSPSDERKGVVRSEFAQDPEMTDLIGYFVSELPHRVEAIGGCLRDERLDDLRTIAHQLKGASAGYGVSTIGDAARRLEEDLKSNAALETIRSDVEDLISLCQRVSV